MRAALGPGQDCRRGAARRRCEDSSKQQEEPRGTIAEWTITILLLLFGTTTLVQAFVIPTGSMEDTLLIGDHLLVDKLAYAPAGPVSKYILPYERRQARRHHRLPLSGRYHADLREARDGVPGDHIKIVNKQVYRNGVKLKSRTCITRIRIRIPIAIISRHRAERMLYRAGAEDMLQNHVMNGEVVVPPDSYFAMGDNRDNSLDSRYWGFVPRENIIGKPLIIYWSYDATTEAWPSSSVNAMSRHFVDLAQHFFTKTRWSRTFMLIHGYHSND